MREPDTKLDAIARQVIGAAIEVHKNLGPGFAESVYEKALEIEMSLRNIAFERQKAAPVMYKGHAVGQGRLDFFVEDELVVELKAIDSLAPVHTAQVISYLTALNKPLGLLFNFKVNRLKDGGIRRVVLSP